MSLLASNSKWSVRHLQRLFVRYTGQTLGKYVQDMRIRKSCEQLHHSQLKIITIAENVGYRHLESFNSVFKKIMGETVSNCIFFLISGALSAASSLLNGLKSNIIILLIS
ncbi:helix-turn-helix transcriptional regulator [Paenibacillus harenae]|uniref:helix-turn-helix transcriptional regulator n=1 Tax=Paenibacillus harenae TaxID=306543 RepID=UPI0035945B88